MRKGELTRRHIVVKAAPLFNQRGFAGCSMQDVMEATGLEKGGIYRHFGSKEELAAEAFRYAWGQVRAARAGDPEQLRGALPRLRHIVHAFVHVRAPIPGGCPLMNTAADVDAGSKVILALAKDGVTAWKAEICGIVEDGVRDGELREELDPRRTANAIISMLEGALMISRLEGTREALADAEVSLAQFLATLER